MHGRSLFIHAGLHKTGTTALQTALAQNPLWITCQGYRFPLAGRPWTNAGHHNIAWEITGDRRFRAEYGTARELVSEVRAGHDHVILSSEDFTGALAKVDRFRAFLGSLREVFPDICFVVFLRNQVEYATSLYLQLLGLGFDRPFDSYLNEITTNREVRWREWCFPFDFRDFLDRIRSLEGVRLKVCSYEMSRNGALLETFLKACAFPVNLSGEPPQLAQEKATRSAGWSIAQFLRNRAGKHLDQTQTLLIECLYQALDSKLLRLSVDDHRLLANTFRISNGSVSELYGVPVHEFIDAHPAPGEPLVLSSLTLSGLLSAELHQFFDDFSSRLRSQMDQVTRPLRAIVSSLQAVEAERDRLRAECDRATAELAALLPAHDAVVLQRDAMLRSRSWKLTAPLRSIALRIRRKQTA